MRWLGSLKNAARMSRWARMPRLPFAPRSRAPRPDAAATQRTRDADRWMSRLSTTKCQRRAIGSVATTPWTWARKSASVRVGPPAGASTAPLTTSRERMNEQVPWRIYSNSRRGTGQIGRAACRGRGEISGGAGSFKKKKRKRSGMEFVNKKINRIYSNHISKKSLNNIVNKKLRKKMYV